MSQSWSRTWGLERRRRERDKEVEIKRGKAGQENREQARHKRSASQAAEKVKKGFFVEGWGESLNCSRVRDDQCYANKRWKRRPCWIIIEALSGDFCSLGEILRHFLLFIPSALYVTAFWRHRPLLDTAREMLYHHYSWCIREQRRHSHHATQRGLQGY